MYVLQASVRSAARKQTNEGPSFICYVGKVDISILARVSETPHDLSCPEPVRIPETCLEPIHTPIQQLNEIDEE